MKLEILLTAGWLVFFSAITLNTQASLNQESLVSCTTTTETPAKTPSGGS